MPGTPKIDLEKVRAAFDAICAKRGYRIPPVEVRTVGSTRGQMLSVRHRLRAAKC